MKTIVIASNNAHKAEEIATALAFPGWEFRTLRQLGLDSDPACLLYTSPSPRDRQKSRMPSSA